MDKKNNETQKRCRKNGSVRTVLRRENERKPAPLYTRQEKGFTGSPEPWNWQYRVAEHKFARPAWDPYITTNKAVPTSLSSVFSLVLSINSTCPGLGHGAWSDCGVPPPTTNVGWVVLELTIWHTAPCYPRDLVWAQVVTIVFFLSPAFEGGFENILIFPRLGLFRLAWDVHTLSTPKLCNSANGFSIQNKIPTKQMAPTDLQSHVHLICRDGCYLQLGTWLGCIRSLTGRHLWRLWLSLVVARSTPARKAYF